MSNLALGEDRLPVVLPSSVARVTANGLPTKHLIDWEQLTRNWYNVNVQALDTKLTEVSSETEGNTAAITQEIQARTSADSALAQQITTVDAKVGTATANGQIFFAAAAVPAGAVAAYGIYLTAGNAFTGLEMIARSDGTAAIALNASQFTLTDSGTAQNVFNYTGGIFTFNVPVRIGTVDILAGAVNAPVVNTVTTTREIGDTGWTSLVSATHTGASGYVALIHVEFRYETGGGSGVITGNYRIRKSNGNVLYTGTLYNFANPFVVTHTLLDTAFNDEYTYYLEVEIETSGPTFVFYRRSIMIDLRKR